MITKDLLKDFPLRWISYRLNKPRFMDRQREIIEGLTLADKRFPDELRLAALGALQNHDLEVVRCGLSALAFVGVADDIPALQRLAMHEDPIVVQDTHTCLFEIKRRLRHA